MEYVRREDHWQVSIGHARGPGRRRGPGSHQRPSGVSDSTSPEDSERKGSTMVSEISEYQGASSDAVRQHYDIGTEFYRLWLDSSLTYSCALWSDGDDLAHAQQRKLDYLIERADIVGAERVLDIGCGWGSLMRRVADRNWQAHITGLTLSRDQYDYVRRHSTDRIDVRLEHWNTHRPDGAYDVIFCVGALEHFVKFGLSRRDRTAAYREFFTHCSRMLRPGGGLVIQTIGKGNRPLDHEALNDVQFLANEIFPESDPPRLAELAHAAEKLFEIGSVVNDRHDYSATCAEWLRRLRSHRTEAERLVGARITESYERYLEASIRQFDREHLVLYRISLRKLTDLPSEA
ncbi:cyclopropane-fatty-acyl-phospholipid synthase family protein [Nocardia wallacei]|uniref:cyclopropane-fatty-acyl-phospholipid synthase family protein n=1 Tax=Nocardia wallacei TaxID=480035 RepID=UPI0024563D90|nr:cyclopropane-fatty-acyl-phospholipid synthase family protein [Nocardia wallacei]